MSERGQLGAELRSVPALAPRFAAGIRMVLQKAGAGIEPARPSIPPSLPKTAGDTSCSMGFCCGARCFNMPHAWQLGWIAPQVLDGASLGPGQTRTVSIAAQSRSPAAASKSRPTGWGAACQPSS